MYAITIKLCVYDGLVNFYLQISSFLLLPHRRWWEVMFSPVSIDIIMSMNNFLAPIPSPIVTKIRQSYRWPQGWLNFGRSRSVGNQWLIDETQVPSNHTDIVVTDVTYQPAVKYFVILQSRVYVSNYVRHLPQRSILVGTIILFTDDVARDFVWFYCQPSQRESMFADGALAAGIGMTRTCSRRLQ